MGVITKLLVLGSITGPPQLREYPVEPVGVASMSPSLQYEVRYLSFTSVSTLIIEVVFFLLMATSLSAKLSSEISLFGGSEVSCNNPLSEIV